VKPTKRPFDLSVARGPIGPIGLFGLFGRDGRVSTALSRLDLI